MAENQCVCYLIIEAIQSRTDHQAVEKELAQAAKKVEKDSEVHYMCHEQHGR